MGNYCIDCGCKTSGDVCSNCQEELYIIENQGEFINYSVSDDFACKVFAQQNYLNSKKGEVK